MKVSSKIVAGFLILMLLAVVVLANQLSVIHQMQAINRDLSEIDMDAASNVLRMQELAGVIKEDARKYIATGDAIYDKQIADIADEFQTRLAGLRKSGPSSRERAETVRLSEALKDFSKVFEASKHRKRQHDPDYLPVDL